MLLYFFGLGLDTITSAFIFAILGFGIFISFKILNFTDLTVEASYTFGAAIAAMISNNISGNMGPILGLFIGFIGGGVAGLITALLHTKLHINSVLSGILTLSAFYSINYWVTNNEANLQVKGKTLFYQAIDSGFNLVIALILMVVVGVILILFFKTKLGLSVRACGDNEQMIEANAVSVDNLKIVGLVLANALCGLAGALYTYLSGYYDYATGTGMMVIGVATIIIGESIFPHKHKIPLMFVAIIIGSIIYRVIYALVIEFNDGSPNNMRIITSAAIILCIGISVLNEYLKNKKSIKYKDSDEVKQC